MHIAPTFIPQTDFLKYPSTIVGTQARQIGQWQALGCPWITVGIIPATTLEHINDQRTAHELMQVYEHYFHGGQVTITSSNQTIATHLTGDANFVHALKTIKQNGPVLVSLVPDVEAAGDVYTCHSLLTHKSQVLVHAFHGSHHADHDLNAGSLFKVDVRTWQIVGRQHHQQAHSFHPEFEGFSKQKLPTTKQESPAIKDEVVLKLAQLAHHCKKQHHHHLRLSWIVSEKKIVLTNIQAWESDHQTIVPTKIATNHRLLVKGVSLQPGKITATAKIIPDVTVQPKTLLIKSGDIVVTKHWYTYLVPYLKKIAGLVIEENILTPSTLKHLKQYGVPTLSKAKGATRLIKNNQTITLHTKPHQTGFVWQSSS